MRMILAILILLALAIPVWIGPDRTVVDGKFHGNTDAYYFWSDSPGNYGESPDVRLYGFYIDDPEKLK